jgi:hypothetical protein
MSDHPFELVEKSDRRTPLQEKHPTRCDHDRAYETDKYPPSGTAYVCADCGSVTQWPRDWE